MKKPAQIIALLKKQYPDVEWVPIDSIYEDSDNPRTINEKEFEALKKSIAKVPVGMVLIGKGVITKDNFLITSNQRHKACKELGWEEFPVIRAVGCTPEQLEELQIKDNLHNGDWDIPKLFADWDIEDLKDWNFDMELLEMEDLSDISTPPPAKNVSHQKTLRMKFTEKDYNVVIKKLKTIAETPEQALWQLLKSVKITTKKPKQ